MHFTEKIDSNGSFKFGQNALKTRLNVSIYPMTIQPEKMKTGNNRHKHDIYTESVSQTNTCCMSGGQVFCN